MATTEQRTGFRLPWTAEPPATNEAAASDDEAVGSVAEPEVETDSIADSTEESMIGEDTVRDTFVTNLAGRAGWDTPEVAVDIDAAPATDEATAAVEATAYSYEADAPTSPKQRTVNPLVAGLVRAMLDAAETARQEAITGLADAAKARKDQIQVESTESEAEARRVTDSDIAEIREWSKAQMARIRGETDVRITDRKHQLEAETGELSALHQHRLDHVQHVVEAYESEMDAFFQTLFTQDDPAQLAGMAQQLPEPPDLADEDEIGAWTPESILAVADAARYETIVTRDVEATAEAEAEAEAETQTEAASSLEPEASVEATDDQAGTLDLAPADVPLTSATSAAAADATDDEPSVTLLSVLGLVSVASIAGFKRAVAKAPGVEAISVVSGPAGDFVFTVRHEADTDLAAIVGGLEEFSAVVTNTEVGLLSVTASAPISLG